MIEENSRREGMSEGLLRQRRNLLLSSCLIFMITFLQVEVNQINFLGTQVAIKNPEHVGLVLLVIHTYFFLRFIQYYIDEGDIPSPLQEIRLNFEAFEKKLFKALAYDKLGDIQLENFEYVYPQYRRLSNDDRMAIENNVPDESIWVINKKVYVVIHIWGKEDKTNILNSNPPGFRETVENRNNWEVVEDPETNTGRSGFFIRNYVEINKIKISYLKLMGFITYIFKQPFFTDYQLPGLIGVVSFILMLVVYKI